MLGAAIEHLAKYLRGTREDGLILDQNCAKSFEVYADSDFCGNWYRLTASDNPLTAKSWPGYILLYEGRPIVWAYKLQNFIPLSST